MEDIKHILLTAKSDIIQLRRENEILFAKVSTMEGILALFYGRPSGIGRGGIEPDIVSEIDKYLATEKKAK